MNDFLMGAYVDNGSAVHRLDERIKLLAFVISIALVLASGNYIMYLIDFALLIICIIASKLNIFTLLSALKRIWLFLLIILLMNALFYSKENSLFSFWIFSVSKNGIIQGLKIALNVVLILLWVNILLSTTTPLKLMNAIRFYLTPLKWLKIPIDDLTLIISVSIQFIPILFEEAQSIKKAQTARGAELESKNIFKKAGAVVPLVVPIFVSAFKRADELSQALEARGYE